MSVTVLTLPHLVIRSPEAVSYRRAVHKTAAYARLEPANGQNHFDFPVRVSGVLMALANPQPSLIHRHRFLHAPPLRVKNCLFRAAPTAP